MFKKFFARHARKLACVAVQVAMVVGTVAAGAYQLTCTEGGEVVKHELLKGLVGGVVGGLAVGAFLAANKLAA